MCKQLPSRSNSKKAKISCQVCNVPLISGKVKDYCLKKRVCGGCLAADAIVLPGLDEQQRFCHQCGRFEPLTLFDGVRRSCQKRLVQRRVRVPPQHRSVTGDKSSSSSPQTLQPQRSAPASTSTATTSEMGVDADMGAAAAAAQPVSSPIPSYTVPSPVPGTSCSVLSATKGTDAAGEQLQRQQSCSSGRAGALSIQGVAHMLANNEGARAAAAAALQLQQQQQQSYSSSGAAGMGCMLASAEGAAAASLQMQKQLQALSSAAVAGACYSQGYDATNMQLQEGHSFSNGDGAAAAMQGIVLSSAPQQQQQHGAGGAHVLSLPAPSAPSAAPGGEFEDFLCAMMQDELGKVMQDEQQAQAPPPQQAQWALTQQQQHAASASGCLAPGMAVGNHLSMSMQGMLSPGSISAALHNAAVAPAGAQGLYRSASSASAPAAAAGMSPAMVSYTSSSNLQALLPAADTDTSPAAVDAAAAAAMAVAEETALRRQELLRQARALLEEERRLRDATSAATAAVTSGFGAAFGGMSQATSPVLSAAAAPHMQLIGGGGLDMPGVGMFGRQGNISVGVQQPRSFSGVTGGGGSMYAGSGLNRVFSAPAAGLPPASFGLPPYSIQQQQQREASGVLLQQLLAAGVINQDTAWPDQVGQLRHQLLQASSQLHELKQAVDGSFWGM